MRRKRGEKDEEEGDPTKYSDGRLGMIPLI